MGRPRTQEAEKTIKGKCGRCGGPFSTSADTRKWCGAYCANKMRAERYWRKRLGITEIIE